MVEGSWLPSGSGSGALLGTGPSGQNQLHAPKYLSHGWGSHQCYYLVPNPNPLITFVKESWEDSLAISLYVLFILSLFLLPAIPFLKKLENVSGMQNSMEESVMNINKKTQPSFKRKCYKSSRNLSLLFLLLSPFIPFSCLPCVSSFVYSCPSLLISLPIFSPNPLCPATFLAPFCITFLLPYPCPFLLFFSSSLSLSLAFFSPASLISSRGSVTHSFGCSVLRVGTPYLLELPLLQTLGYLPLRG